MANDAAPSSASTDTIPYPTLTTVYLPAEAEAAIEEISQRYNNMTVEDCKGFFHQGKEKEYKKITIWSQGIDSLWFNAIIARIKELSKLESRSRFKGIILLSADDPTICNIGLLFLSQGSLVKIVPLEILDGIEL